MRDNGQAPRPERAYLYVDQLAELTPWTAHQIRNMIANGTFLEGVHYFKPNGPGSRPIFSWRAVSAFIESKPPCPPPPTIAGEDEVMRQARALLAGTSQAGR